MATTKDLSKLIDREMGKGQGPFLVRIFQDAAILPRVKRGGFRAMEHLTPEHLADVGVIGRVIRHVALSSVPVRRRQSVLKNLINPSRPRTLSPLPSRRLINKARTSKTKLKISRLSRRWSHPTTRLRRHRRTSRQRHDGWQLSIMFMPAANLIFAHLTGSFTNHTS